MTELDDFKAIFDETPSTPVRSGGANIDTNYALGQHASIFDKYSSKEFKIDVPERNFTQVQSLIEIILFLLLAVFLLTFSFKKLFRFIYPSINHENLLHRLITTSGYSLTAIIFFFWWFFGAEILNEYVDAGERFFQAILIAGMIFLIYFSILQRSIYFVIYGQDKKYQNKSNKSSHIKWFDLSAAKRFLQMNQGMLVQYLYYSLLAIAFIYATLKSIIKDEIFIGGFIGSFVGVILGGFIFASPVYLVCKCIKKIKQNAKKYYLVSACSLGMLAALGSILLLFSGK